MEKIVAYNGGTEGYYSCSDPSVLTIGQMYEVIAQTDRGWQTDYTLAGVEGSFNSSWFDVITAPIVYMALAQTRPVVGQEYKCFKIEIIGGKPKLISWTTSDVLDVLDLGNNIYQVTTRISIYIVLVG